MGKFDNKVAVITGGARGLGKGFAELLLDRGAKVAILDILELEGKETAREFCEKYGEGKAVYIYCDVSSPQGRSDAILEVLTTFHNYDILVNNAGVDNEMNMSLTTDINLKAVIWFALHAEKYMNKLKGGRGGIIVNIASLAGLIGSPLIPVYCATKHGVVGLTKAMAETAKLTQPDSGVKVVALCPAFADTKIVTTDRPYLTEQNRKLLQSFIESNFMPVSSVVRAFDHLIADSTANGSVLSVSQLHGEVYMYPTSMKKRNQAKL